MKCPACSHENRDGAKFCEECAAQLKRLCASCGAELRPTAKFCDECGATTATVGARSESRAGGARPARAAETADARKVVTVVFADLVGSTALHERVDAESARRLMERYYDALRAAVDEHGGTVVKLLGDGVMAAFGVPQVAEDDALRAVRAGMAMQEAFRVLVSEQAASLGDVGLRVAANTGEVVVSGANDDVVGDPVNIAARLQQEARDGDVVIGEATQRLVSTLVTLEPLGSFALKGRAEAVKAYRVVSLERPAGASATPFVGREDELARITRVYDTAVATPAARLAVLLGSPGLGKSRLIDELARRQSETATVISAHCDSTGGATFAPIARALRRALHIDDGASIETLRAAVDADTPGSEPDRARIVDGITTLLAGSPASPEETFFVVRRLLAALATERPVVLVIDDLHWAEPLLLDLVEHLIQWGSGVPLLVLVGARPELRDARSSLATPGGLVADVVTLSGLDAGAAMRLAANVIGASDLPAAVAAKVLATSEGNPLFVGELIRMLVQEGALERHGDRWTIGAGLAELEMPPTIHALLAARIERLRAEERIVLERAAVVGRHFSRSAVAELLPHDVTDLDTRLEALRRSELIERDTGWFLGEPVLRFHHVLIRDAAYRRVLKGTRAELHARFADWIEARVGESAEHDEILGWHLEQAHLYLGELGPIDAKGRVLGERAARYLAAAGRRALARDDLPLAASLLGRALARLDADDPSRADLALDWCEALLATGDVGPAAAAIAELGRFISDSERLRAWHTCFAGQLTVFTEPQALHETADAVAAAAEKLTALGDSAGEAKAHFVHAQALARLGNIGACEAALDRALAAARRAGDRRRANAVLAGAPLAALWGPSPVTRASGRCLDVVRVLRITQGAPAVEAVALSCQGVLEALRGRTDAARRMIASSRKMVEELGITHRLLEADVFAGQIDLLEGDAATAEKSLRGAYEGLRALGLGIDAAQAAALLARALLAQGRAAEAEALSHESEELAGDDLKAAIAWRCVRAEALARRGEHTQAVELAEAAVAIASATDALLDHADARLALAATLSAAGRGSEANAEERRATELWEAKGATLLAERARHGATRVDAPTQAREAREARVEPTGRARCRVRPNAATAETVRLDAAIAARDPNALRELFAEDLEVDDHTTGIVFDRQGALSSFGSLISARNPTCRNEPIAALGDALAICRFSASASGLGRGRLDVGAYEKEEIHLIEVDAEGRRHRGEVFATDHLDDAIARLYERYAELLLVGPARARAEGTARAVAAILKITNDAERWRTACAPDAQMVDHRQLGTWNAGGSDAIVAQMSSLRAVADDVVLHTLEVLALEPEALLLRRMHSGTERVGGGAYERPLLLLLAFGADGLVASVEFFDDDSEPAALARFHALIGRTEAESPRPVQRRVRMNAARALGARVNAAFAAGDLEAFLALHSETHVAIDHPTGATYGRDGAVASMKRMLRSRDVSVHHEPLATLGESLDLFRRKVNGIGAAGARFDVGAYEDETVVLDEVDAQGKSVRREVFAADHLGEAVARLYTRYAELLPEGPARVRASMTARAVTGMLTESKDIRLEDVMVPDIQSFDHRLVGYGAAEGAEFGGRWRDAWDELTQDRLVRVEDVLAVTPDGLLRRSTHYGTLRSSGGAFESTGYVIALFGPDGRHTRFEVFDVGHEAEALARFDQLVGGTDAELSAQPTVTRFSNAATRLNEGFVRTWAARDWDAFMALHAPACELDDRRRLMRVEESTTSNFPTLRLLFEVPGGRWTITPLATRGERLALSRLLFEGQFVEGGGDLAIDYLCVDEVDAKGLSAAVILFDLDDLDSAYTELDARYDAGEAKLYERASGWLQRFRRALAALAGRDWDVLVSLCAPDVVAEDHRLVSWGTLRGPVAYVAALKSLLDLAPDTRLRVDHVRTSPFGVLYEGAWLGTRDGGEFESPHIIAYELDELGKLLRLDAYDSNRLDDARARFDAIGASAKPPQNPFANAATRFNERIAHAWVARDWDAILALHAPTGGMEDRRRLMHMQFAHDAGGLAQLRFMFDVPGSRWEIAPLATRGERLSLSRCMYEGNVDEDGGALAIDYLMVDEVGADGRNVAVVIFDPDDLDAAYAELDARYQSGEACDQPLALATMTSLRTAWIERDWAGMVAKCGPRFHLRDHRLLGWGTSVADSAEWVRTQQALVELAPDVRIRTANVRLCARGWLRHAVSVGTRDGGAFELPLVMVTELDERGLLAGHDLYDPEQLAQAFARFEEIRETAAEPEPCFANTATQTVDRATAAFEARDWERFGALFAEEFRNIDRRAMFQLETDREQWLAAYRQIVEMTSSRPMRQVLATRGDRLALVHVLWRGAEGDIGPSEIDWLLVIEVNERGDHKLVVTFDADDLDAAYAELEARFNAGEAMAYPRTLAWRQLFGDAFVRRDWDAIAAAYSSDVVAYDHRFVGWEIARGPAQVVAPLRALCELAPDVRARADHVRVSSRGLLFQSMWIGTRDGGDFESLFLSVVELGDDGKPRRTDFYDPKDYEEARARFEEIRASETQPEPRFANAASRAVARTMRAFNARDWDGMMATYAPDHRMDDRRRLMRIAVAGEGFFENERFLFEVPGSAWHSELVATRGERLALCRVRFTAGGEDAGPMMLDVLDVIEVDSKGRRTGLVAFDVEDVDAAYAELDARFGAGEGRQYPRMLESARAQASAARTTRWDAFAAICAPTFCYRDHRLLGWGTVRDVETFGRTIQSAFDLAPDARYRLDHVRFCERGQLNQIVLVGTRDGGAFENPLIRIDELDEQGKILHLDSYDVDDYDRALARFDEVRASTTKPEPHFTNAATRAMDSWGERFRIASETGDWDPLRRLCATEMIFEDRRRMALLAGGSDLMVASARERFASGARAEKWLVELAGDRIATFRLLWSGGPADGRFEIEYLGVLEANEAGQLTAIIFFDCDAARLARREAWTRWAAIDPVVAPWVKLLTEIEDAWNAHDRARTRAIFADDIVVEDHRHSGLGRVAGADAYTETFTVLWDLAPDQRVEFDGSWLAHDRHGVLLRLRREGTLADGGAFENDYLWLGVAKDGRLTRLELFEPEDLERALARFEELRPDPLSIPPNAALRTGMRVRDAMERADWDAVRSLCDEGFVYEDRGKRSLVSGDVETWIASMEFMVAIPDYRNESQRLATMGERITIGYEVWTGGSATAPFEIAHFRVTEVAADGRSLATILFDPEDRAAAFSEALGRFLVGEAAAVGGRAGILAFHHAEAMRDWGAMRETLTSDFVFYDHRTLGMGQLDRDRWIASIRALVEMSPDLTVEWLQALAWDRHGLVMVTRTFGTVPDGGPFENVFVAVRQMTGDLTKRYEVFNLDDVDRALACFEERSTSSASDPLRIPSNAATRALERNAKVITAGDWATLRGVLSEAFVFEDRGKRSLVKGGVEELVGGLTYYVSEVRAAGRQEILATAGEHLALTRVTWRGLRDAAQFELARLAVNEVNDEGKLCATILFDDDGRAAASAEMAERYFRSADDLPSATLDIMSAWNDHDLERLRTLLPADYYFYDRRRTGVGRLDGADAYLASLEALFQLSRDVRIETLYIAVRAPHGAVNVTRWSGTNAEGGEFEVVGVFVGLQRGEQVFGVEIFEIEHLDAALARFDELRPDPLRIGPNAATRAVDRIGEIYLARDWDALRDLAAPDFVYDDRGKRALVVGDVETWIGTMQFTRQPGFRAEMSLLAALGDRIALDRVVWAGKPGGDAFEFERIRLLETGPDGRVRIAIFFDPEDRAAAFSEALERFLAGEAAAMSGSAAVLAAQRASARRDWIALRETMAPDFVYQDHRTLGVLGVLDRDRWIASIRALVDMSPDHAVEWSQVLAWNRHGFVAVARTFGTVPDGGPFENVFIAVRQIANDLTQRYEVFDLDHADRALARFEELCAGGFHA